MATAASNLKLIHKRVENLLNQDRVLTPYEQSELEVLGRLALHMDDVKYRKAHTTGAEAKSVERKALKKK